MDLFQKAIEKDNRNDIYICIVCEKIQYKSLLISLLIDQSHFLLLVLCFGSFIVLLFCIITIGGQWRREGSGLEAMFNKIDGEM